MVFQSEADLGLEAIGEQQSILMEGILGNRSTFLGKTLHELNFEQRYGVIPWPCIARARTCGKIFRTSSWLLATRCWCKARPKRFIGLCRSVTSSVSPNRHNARFAGNSAARGRRNSQRNCVRCVSRAAHCRARAYRRDIRRPHALPRHRGSARRHPMENSLHDFRYARAGVAMEKTGAAHLIASGVTGAVGHFGPRVTLSVMYLLATILTELISNNAVALLITPIAFEIAAAMGVDARPFAVAVMFGCAASFATPIGHQTNTYVFGAGGYRFADFPKIGAPLNIILWIVASIFIPIFWPFVPK